MIYHKYHGVSRSCTAWVGQDSRNNNLDLYILSVTTLNFILVLPVSVPRGNKALNLTQPCMHRFLLDELHYITLRYVMLCYVILQYIVLCCILLYYIVILQQDGMI